MNIRTILIIVNKYIYTYYQEIRWLVEDWRKNLFDDT